MAIQRWDPIRDLVELQKKMNLLFEETFSRSVGADGKEPSDPGGWKPSTDLYEEEDQYILRADLPGVAAGDIDIKIEKGTLHIRGERKLDNKITHEAYLRVERPHGRFAVEVALSPTVDRSAISAVHRNGVIEISMPKQQTELSSNVPISTK